MSEAPLIVGWREWINMPDLGIPLIKAKIDTGARISCLNTFFLEKTGDDQKRVRFGVHPRQRDKTLEVVCETDIIDERWVSEGGRRDLRVVIATTIVLGGRRWPIELSLNNLEGASFRLILGRNAMDQNILVNPADSWLLGEQESDVNGD